MPSPTPQRPSVTPLMEITAEWRALRWIPDDEHRLRRSPSLATMRRYEISLHFNLVSEGPAPLLDQPEAVHLYLAPFFATNPMQEQFFVVCLNRKNRSLGAHRVTTGTLTSSLVAPREVFRTAILASAAAIVVAHNHPSGDPIPSSADIAVTRQIKEASRALGIDLLDHVISGEIDCDPAHVGFYSFRSAGLI